MDIMQWPVSNEHKKVKLTKPFYIYYRSKTSLKQTHITKKNYITNPIVLFISLHQVHTDI